MSCDLARGSSIIAMLLIAAVGAGCVSAPAVVIVDRKTALEQQASGSFRGVEEELEQAGLVPRPVPLTPGQLGQAGVRRDGLETTGEDSGGSDALITDGLLIQRCAGESLDGTLALTIDSCTGTIDVPSVGRLIERVNRERRQLWRWLAGQSKGKTDDQVRTAWRETHLVGLVCGGQLQVAGGAWEIKRC